MKILFTGGSSFTGYWFIKELCEAGHDVAAIFRRSFGDYEGVRFYRVNALRSLCRCYEECSYCSEPFFDLIEQSGPWGLFCHHAADVTNYKSLDFDVVAALHNNVGEIDSVLSLLQHNGCNAVVLTGSVFEQREGVGSFPHSAFSPYGLSKGLTSDVFRYYTERRGMILGKFVIPNPFGPCEEERFTTFLARSWLEWSCPVVKTSRYVRDNIPVSLLAKAYSAFISRLCNGTERYLQHSPSGYAETQRAFVTRFSQELHSRLSLPCEVEFVEQTEFSEPCVRINTDMLDYDMLGWDEQCAWDDLAVYYQQLCKKERSIPC